MLLLIVISAAVLEISPAELEERKTRSVPLVDGTNDEAATNIVEGEENGK